MICIHCEINAGRTTKGLACCELRRLALAPSHAVKAHAATLTQEERDELRPLFAVEKERLKNL